MLVTKRQGLSAVGFVLMPIWSSACKLVTVPSCVDWSRRDSPVSMHASLTHATSYKAVEMQPGIPCTVHAQH